MTDTEDTEEDDSAGADHGSLRSELYDILDEQSGHWVDVDTVVVNHHEVLDPKADYSEHATLREAVKDHLEDLAERDDVEHESAWGSEFFRVS